MFEMKIEEIFEIPGRGIVVTGHPSDSIEPGSAVEIWNPDGSAIDTSIFGIEMFGPWKPGRSVSLILRRSETLTDRKDIHAGAYMRLVT